MSEAPPVAPLVAVVGGGQLGRMLALSGHRLGVRFRFLDPDPDCPAGQVAELVCGAYDDPAALARLVEGADVATFEFENVPHGTAAWLHAHAVGGATGRRAGRALQGVFPPPRALEIGQDRLAEKAFFVSCGIPVVRHAAVDGEPALDAAIAAVGLPGILKTRRLGYDGKGQAAVASRADAALAWRQLGGVPCVLEERVDFEREVSSIGVRGRDGATMVYPLVENVHRQGILHRSSVPVQLADEAGRGGLEAAAAAATRRLLAELAYVGTLCIEFFLHRGRLVANEFAPRVHNSGHWTIEGAETSQFENHIRAVLGLPLGGVGLRGRITMTNLVGTAPSLAELLADPRAAVHLYGKAPRPGRKLGHVTVVEGCEAAGGRS